MPLPRIKIPLFDVTIPSSKKQAKFRPFLVKEEKILLMAQSGGSRKEVINALIQVINNCVTNIDGTALNVNELTTFDLEYIFLKLRAKSVDNIIKLQYVDHEDEKTYSFEVPLDDINVQYHEEHNTKIKVDDDIGIIMKYPKALDINTVDENETTEQFSISMLRSCIEKIYDTDSVYLANECTPEELDEFIDSLSVKAFTDIQKFFETMPKLYHKIEYTNSLGTERTIELSTLNDFFTLD
jgi:hypothetical protein